MIKDILLFILSLFVMAAFFIASYYIFASHIDTTDSNMLLLIGTAYGTISAKTTDIITYWFGSSKGSSDKDKTIQEMNLNQPKQTGA